MALLLLHLKNKTTRFFWVSVLHQPTVIAAEEITVGIFLNGMVAHMDHGYGFWFVLAILILLTAVIIYLGLNYEKLG